MLGSTKRSDFDVTIVIHAREQQVFWLEVAMCDVSFMQVGHRFEDGFRALASLKFGVSPLFHNMVEQLPPFHLRSKRRPGSDYPRSQSASTKRCDENGRTHQFCDKVNLLGIVIVLIETFDVRVVNFFQDFNLLLQSNFILMG